MSKYQHLQILTSLRRMKLNKMIEVLEEIGAFLYRQKVDKILKRSQTD